MKKVLLLALVMLTAYGTSHAQGNVLKLNMISPLVNTFNIQYERRLGVQSSAQIGFFSTGYSLFGVIHSGYGVTPEFRFYLSETEAPAGFFVAPFLRYRNFDLKDGNDVAKYTSFGGGIIMGRQWIFKGRVALEIFGGPGYADRYLDRKGSNNDFNKGNLDGYTFRGGFCLGLAF